MKKFLLVLSLFLMLNISYAQNPPQDPALKKQAETHWVLSSDYLKDKVKNYRKAANSLHWLMTNAPEFSGGVYINAYKAYEQLGALEADPQKKAVFLDSMLTSYDLKAKRFNLNIREINNLAFKYYKYFRNSPSKITDALAAYDEVYKVPAKVINNNVVAYMHILVQYKKYGNEVSLDKAFEVHTRIMDVIEMKKEAGVDIEKLTKYRKAVNSYFQRLVGEEGVDCNTINEKFGPKYDESPDLNWAKSIFTLILNNKCTQSPYYIKTAIGIYGYEPTEGLATLIAEFHAKNEDYSMAIEWYEDAISISDSRVKKAGIHMNIANIYAVDGQKAEARRAAFKAAELDNQTSVDAYNFIGNLYMGSFEDCKKTKSHVDDRAVFMLAYDMFQRAGNMKGMKNAQEQFPTRSQAHSESTKEMSKADGSPITVGCWIQQKTTIKTRKSN